MKPANSRLTSEALRPSENQAASAVESARLFEQAQRRAGELAVLNEVGRALTSVLSLDELYRVLHQQVGRLMDANSFYVALYEADKDEIFIPYTVDEGVASEPVRRGLRDPGGRTDLSLQGLR